MTTKQLNYKALPIITAADGATSPALNANDKGAMAFSTTTNKPMSWDGTKWNVVNKVDSVAGRTGAVTVTKADVGLGSVDNVAAASLRDRTTHTGEQAISSITGLQTALDGKAATSHTHFEATTAIAGFMSSADKNKLNGIATGANAYVHPTSGATAGTYKSVTVDANGHVTAGSNPTTLAGYGITDAAASSHTHANATTTVAGFMSADDKAKLDLVQSFANNYIHPETNVQPGTYRSLTVDVKGHVTAGSNPNTLAGYGITDAAASNHTHAIATTTAAGFMDSADKAKLNNISNFANNYVHPANHPASIITQDANNRFVTDAEKTTWNAKIGSVKTINGQSIIGSGDLVLATPSTFATDITVNGHKFGRGANSDIHTNVAAGMQVLSANTTGNKNTASGFNAMQSNTEGSDNTAYGCVALRYNTTGNRNTAYGSSALGANTTGHGNTAYGFSALSNSTTSSDNTAYGAAALNSNTTGTNNTATGVSALSQNTTGYNNTATGMQALNANTTGYHNTAVGFWAMLYNTTGAQNTASGYVAMLHNSDGNFNAAYGARALYSNTTGSQNTATGSGALETNTTGVQNTAIGAGALSSNRTGNGNTVIGSQYITSGAYAPVFNITTENNRVVMAHTNVTHAYIQVPWTVVSDARDKTNFASIPHGLEFVKQLKPTAYQFRVSRNSDTTNGGVRYGFKAQDIAAIEPEGIIVDTSDKDLLRYNESNLIPILVKAIQELSAEVERLKNANTNS